MTFQFSENYDYVYIKNNDGSISATPTSLLSEEDKQFIYEQLTF